MSNKQSPLAQDTLKFDSFERSLNQASVTRVPLGDPVGNTITRSPDVAKISFTGSTRVGKLINRDATETMKRVGLINTGSACIAGTRILVPASRAAEFKAALKAGMEALKPGRSRRSRDLHPAHDHGRPLAARPGLHPQRPGRGRRTRDGRAR